MPVSANPVSGFPTFDISLKGTKATRKVRIAGTDLDAFVAEIFPVTFTSGTSNVVRAGAAHPDYSFLYAQSMKVAPAEVSKDDNYAATNDAVPQNYECTIQYDSAVAVQSDNDNSDPKDPVTHLTHRWAAGGEFLTLPSMGLKWDDGDGEPVTSEVSAGMIVPQIEHQITWPRITNPPFSAIRNTIGKVNDAALTFKTGTIDVETLLFLGCELQREVMSDGARAWNLSYRFSERRVLSGDDTDPAAATSLYGGWNHFFRSRPKDDKSGWYRLVKKGGSDDAKYVAAYAIYQQATFSNLFTAESSS